MSRVGRYEVLGEIGHGGMGIVYLARDPVLGRRVALKRPTAEVVHDDELRQRFLREARAASTIDHPNVVTVYEVFEEGGVPWLAMALVDGHSLRDLLESEGPLPLDQVLQHGVGLAGALAAAHDHHVLHRDVNPNNILVTRDGRAMLADFGLARYHLEEGELSKVSTMDRTMTETGHVRGTPGYMSPEQAQGLPLDPRTDIYSLGLVLAEACTGRRPGGARLAEGEISAPILEREGDRTPSRGLDVAGELERILRRASSPRVQERHPSADDLLDDLRGVLRRHQFERYSQDHTAEVIRPRRAWLPVSILAAASILVAVGLYAWRQGDRPEPLETRATRIVAWPGHESDGRLSPDGQWISFLSERDGSDAVWIRRLDGGEPRRLAEGKSHVLSHAWSPDGREIVQLVQEEGQALLEAIPAPLGGPRRFHEPLGNVFVHRIVRWTEDGIFLESGRSLWQFSFDPVSLVEVAPHDPAFEFRRQFDVHPERGNLLFSGVREGREGVWLASSDGSRPRRLSGGEHHVSDPRWAGGGNLLFLSDRGGPSGIWQTNRDGNEVWPVPFAKEAAYLDDVALDGSRALVRVVEEKANLWWLDPASPRPRQMSGGSGYEFAPTYAREVVLFQRARPGASSGFAMTVADLVRARWNGSRFIDEGVVVEGGYSPRLAPDGRRFAFLRASSEGPYFTELWLGELDGAQPRRLAERFQMTGLITFPLELLGDAVLWSPSGDLYFVDVAGDGRTRLMRLEAGGRDPVPLATSSRAYQEIVDPALSGDGKRLAYVHYSMDEGGWEAREIDLGGGEPVTFHREALPADGRLRVLGESSPGAWVLARSVGLISGIADLDLLQAGPAGPARVLGTIPEAVESTTHLDVERKVVYLTIRASGVHNLAAAPLEGTGARPLTDNQLPGTTFSGIEILTEGTLLFSRHDVNEDLWLLEITDQAAPGARETR